MTTPKPLTPEEFKVKMERFASKDDPERTHWSADEIMLELLILLGYDEGVTIYRSMERWYS